MDNKEIGIRILSARKNLGYTQKQLGNLINVSDKAVSKWERGIGCPDISLLLPLSEALKMSIDELIGGTVVDKSEKKTVQNLINYTKIKAIENKERIIKISYLFITIVMMIGIFVPCLCNYDLNHSFTWSIISSAAIIYAWIILTVLVQAKENVVIKAIIVASIGVIPLLYVVSVQVYSLDWFLHEALVIALFTNLYVYIVIWIWVKTTLNIWYKIGLCIYLLNITNIPANYISGVNLFSMIMNLALNMIVGTIIIMVGYTRKHN